MMELALYASFSRGEGRRVLGTRRYHVYYFVYDGDLGEDIEYAVTR